MATRWETFPIPLTGGLITNLGRLEQGIRAPGSATMLQNFEPDVQGGYTRLQGFVKFSSTQVTGTGLIRGIVALSPSECLVERGGKYYYSSGTTWTEKLTLTNSSILRVRSETYLFGTDSKTVVVDGVNPPAYYNHTSSTMAYTVGPPSDVNGANRVKVFKSHLFFTKGNILSFAAPFTDDDFDPANGAGAINVGDTITGLTVFRDQLIIFCLNKIFRLSGNSEADFVLSPITNNTGCLCGDTVQEVGGDIMYLGPDGIRYLSASERENDFGLVRASEKIQNQVLEVASTECVYSSVTISKKNQYRLFYYVGNTTATNSRGFLATKYSNQTADNISWATIKGVRVYSLSKYQDRESEVILFGSDTGFVYRMEAGNSFDGENIEAIFETPFIPVNDPKIRKTFYKHTLYVRPSATFELECALRFDYNQANSSSPKSFVVKSAGGASAYEDATSVYGTSVYGSRGDEQYFTNVVGSGFVVALRYKSSTQSAPFNLNFVILEYRTNERR